MVTCAVPFMASEDSDALIGNTTGMSLNTDSAVLYKTGGTSSIQLSISQYISGDNPSAAGWAFNNTTLEFITTAGESYIGMIFWGSPDAERAPDFPGYPAA